MLTSAILLFSECSRKSDNSCAIVSEDPIRKFLFELIGTLEQAIIRLLEKKRAPFGAKQTFSLSWAIKELLVRKPPVEPSGMM